VIGRLKKSFSGSGRGRYIPMYSDWLNANWSFWTLRSHCRIFVFRQGTVWNDSPATVLDSTASA